MARPKPRVILTRPTPKWREEQVIAADYIFAVYYRGAPFNLRIIEALRNYPGPKYKKVAFSNHAHAFLLARKLNKAFNCNDFQVYRLSQGQRVVQVRTTAVPDNER